MVVWKKKGHKINNYQIKHLTAKVRVVELLTGTWQQAEHSLELAEQAYARLVPRAWDLRDEEQLEL